MNGRFRQYVCSVGMMLLLLPTLAAAQRPEYDFIILERISLTALALRGFAGDIAIAGDRIVAIGDLGKASARKRLDANGLVVSPGFIDVQGQSEFNLLVDNRVASKITQGVTTEITGEGSSIAPINDRLEKGERRSRQEIWRDPGLVDAPRILQTFRTDKIGHQLGDVCGSRWRPQLCDGYRQSAGIAGGTGADASARCPGDAGRCDGNQHRAGVRSGHFCFHR